MVKSANTQKANASVSTEIISLASLLEGDDEDLLTVREVAAACRVDDTTTRRWIKSGALPAVTLPHRGRRCAYRIKRGELRRIFTP
jgi:excisionase family DNA binding protein